MLNFGSFVQKMNVDDGGSRGNTGTPAMTNNNMTESQAIQLRKVTAIAILTELAHFYRDKGETQFSVLKKVEEQARQTVNSLVLPRAMAMDIVKKAMGHCYQNVSRRNRMMATMIEGIKEINSEDPGGADAGIGLPKDLKAAIIRMEKWDKVIDETNDLIVEAGGNKFVETCLSNMKSHLPEDFYKIV